MPEGTGGAPAPASSASAQPTSNAQADQQSQQSQGGQPTKPAQPAQASQQPKAWKSKVNGKDVTWTNEEELVRDASLGKSAFEKMREAAEERKRAQELLKKYEENPLAALENPKLTKEQRRELIEQYYKREYLDTDQMTPEQKRVKELEAWKAQREQEDLSKAEQARLEAQQKHVARFQEDYQKQIIEAIEKGKLPKDPYTAGRVAFFMAQALENDFDAPLEMIVSQVRAEEKNRIASYCSAETPIETIIETLGPDLLKRLRQYDIAQYKARQAKAAGLVPETSAEADAAPKPKRQSRLSYSQVLSKLGG